MPRSSRSFLSVVAGIDHHHARLVEFEMAFDERQHAPSDRPEADHHQGSRDLAFADLVAFVEQDDLVGIVRRIFATRGFVDFATRCLVAQELV
jgi:hypothetical protein